jgi:hypothetical protein
MPFPPVLLHPFPCPKKVPPTPRFPNDRDTGKPQVTPKEIKGLVRITKQYEKKEKVSEC